MSKHLIDFIIEKQELKADKKDVTSNETKLTSIENSIKKVFYRAHCKHNNDTDVEFYADSDIMNHSSNVSQSDGDFTVDSSDTKKLKIVNGGLYALYFYDGYRSSGGCNIVLKLDNTVMNSNNGNWYDYKALPGTSNNWMNMNYSTILEIEDNTSLEMYIENNTPMLDGKYYSRLVLYKLM